MWHIIKVQLALFVAYRKIAIVVYHRWQIASLSKATEAKHLWHITEM